MEFKNNFIKISICILCAILIGFPSYLFYISQKDLHALNEQFSHFKAESEDALEEKDQELISLKKEIKFHDIDYDIGDINYGSCGTALSGTFLEMVVDWREDSVYNPQEKTAYLTFDDGPTQRTGEILDILDTYNIKATFFVIGTRNEDNKAFYKEIVERGHTLGIHSQSHKYEVIYESLDSYLTDFNEIFSEVKERTGITPVLFRFPGGSNNSKMTVNGTEAAIKEEMAARGFTYFDWNVSGEDSKYKYISPEKITENVISGAKNKHKAVILLHDSSNKQTTVAALPKIIEGLQDQGFVFDKITADLVPLQFN